MHTVAVHMVTDPARREEVVRHLRDDVVPWATSRPGFVSGRWLLTRDGERGLGLVVFATAEAAEQAAEGPRNYRPTEARAWSIDRVDVYEQVAEAAGVAPG